MKRKLGLLALSLALMLALCACTTKAEGAKTAPDGEAPTVSIGLAAPGEATPVLEVPTTTPQTAGTRVSGTVAERMKNMLPILDSVYGTLGVRGGAEYMPQDPDYFWVVLYLVGVNWGEGAVHDVGNGIVSVRKSVMQEYAAAAFASYTGLPALPSSCNDYMRYDAATETYRLMASDGGDLETEIESFTRNTDGTYYAFLHITAGDGEEIGRVRFSLVDNANGGRYAFSVTGMARMEATDGIWEPVTIGETVTVDLDGDGRNETISTASGNEDGLTLTIERDGKKYTDKYEYLYNATLHIGDTATGDGRRELYVCGDTASDDYETFVYSLVNGEVHKEEIWGFVENIDGNGNVWYDLQTDVIGTWSGVVTAKWNADGTFTPTTDRSIQQYDEAWKDRAVKLKADGLKVTTLAGKEMQLKKGDTILPLSSDMESYVLCELSDGTVVRLEVKQNAEYWGWIVGGKEESEWFEELLYAG